VLLSEYCGLGKQSLALVEGITSLNITDLKTKIGRCTNDDMQQIEKAIKIQNGIKPFDFNKIFLIIARLNENINYVCKYNYDNREYKHERDLLLVELHSCCQRWQIDYNNIERMINLGEIRGRRENRNVEVACM
jgi:hypothetical protein